LADSAQEVYVAGLTLLARRELSEAQVRQRLLRRGYPPGDVDTAIERLKAERALDDARVAEAIARTEIALHQRGRLRVDRQIARAGIAKATAKQAVEQVYGDVDADALLATALTKRLRGADHIADQKTFQRLYRYLIGQGFESERIVSALRRITRKLVEPDDR
jgi:regulatory protein